MVDFIPNFIVQSEMILRIIFVIIASWIIGLEREYKWESAWLRTHILIWLGACIAMVLSISYINLNPDSGIDALRIAWSVMSGIWFLWAWAIMQVGLNTKWLTTAANIWVVAALWLLIWAGFYYISVLVVIIILINLIVISKLEKYFIFGYMHFQMKIQLESEDMDISDLKSELTLLCIKLESLEYSEEEKWISIKITGRIQRSNSLGEISKKLKQKFDIKKISIIEN